MGNRLNLDWTLSTAKERSDFLNTYIEEDLFKKKPPTEEELETMANYLLWGQDPDGLNPDQRKEIQLPRKYSTWATQNIDSLEELLENPNFSENSIYKLGAAAPKKVREVFSRQLLQKKLTPTELIPFENLWRQIDETELKINLYEFEKGKRKNPPRKELLDRFSEEEYEQTRQLAQKLNQFQYLKLRHLLVELRRQQYTLRDSFSEVILPRGIAPPHFNQPPSEEILIWPLGTKKETPLLFQPIEQLIPPNFTNTDLKQISKLYWRKQNEFQQIDLFHFDFRDLEMVYQLFLELENLGEEEKDTLSETPALIETLWFYIEEANLSEIHSQILQMKIKKFKNQDIATTINTKFNKNYTTNYISTIFRQKIIPMINATAAYHEKVVGSLFFEEEFKRCAQCGRLLLRDPINFVRRSRAKDGLSNHCKRCDKEEREKKKEGKTK